MSRALGARVALIPSYRKLGMRDFCIAEGEEKLYGCCMFSLPAMSMDEKGLLGSSADPKSIWDSIGRAVVSGL